MSRPAATIVLCLLLCACAKDAPPPPPVPGAADAPDAQGFVSFRAVGERSGIDYMHDNGADPRKMILETMCGGVAVIDFDDDGWPDLYFVDGGKLPSRTSEQQPGGNRLYRNLGNWKFEDVTAASGARGRGYMMGAVVGDYDGDGHADLYVTAYGSNTLLRNRGDGTFEDVTRAAGCDDPRWSSGAAFFDYDNDGDLDLFVQNYVDWRVEDYRPYELRGLPSYPTPDLYEPVSNSLFRNRGDGTFENVSESSGIGALKAKGLGVVTADFDDDGDIDIYCADDITPNLLFANLGDGTFREMGAISGAAYSAEGREESGMGVDAGDLFGDGHLDILVSNFAGEPNAIYRGEGKLFFTEISIRTGTWKSSVPRLGFGVRIADFDNDGLREFVVANGHVYDNAEQVAPPSTSRQAPLLYQGLGNGRFADRTDSQPPEFQKPRFGRGLASSDFDNDGDSDLVICDLGARPQLFENVGGSARNWISVRCIASRDGTGVGARVTVEAGGRTQFDEVKSGGGYLSQSDTRLLFGLADASRVERIDVRWLDGTHSELRGIPARTRVVVRQPGGAQR